MRLRPLQSVIGPATSSAAPSDEAELDSNDELAVGFSDHAIAETQQFFNIVPEDRRLRGRDDNSIGHLRRAGLRIVPGRSSSTSRTHILFPGDHTRNKQILGPWAEISAIRSGWQDYGRFLWNK